MSPLRRLFGYVGRYRRAFGLGLMCTIATQALALASPKVLQHAIDDLTAGVTQAKLFVYGSLILGIGLTSALFRFLMRRLLIGASRDIEYDMRNEFFAHLQTLPAAYFQAHRTGDLMSRATNDLNAVRMMMGPSIMYSTNTILTFVVALLLMISIDARLTLFALIPLPFVSVTVKLFGGAIHRRFEQIQAQLSDLSAVAQESLAGVRVVRAYRQEQTELDRFRRSNEEYMRRNRRLIVLQGLFFPSMSLFLGFGTMVVLWLGSGEVIRGRITVGEFVAFNVYLAMLSWPMIAFGWVTNMFQRGTASWKRMLEVLDTQPTIVDAPKAHVPGGNVEVAVGRLEGAIEFRDLTFGYGERPVLEHVSATIPAGQTVALVGPTGSGKSTLIALVARLYDPPPRTVFIDGVDVREMPLAVLRRAVGFVPQEPFLFSDTLADNIAFGFDARDVVRLKPSRSGDGDDRGTIASAERQDLRSAKASAERQDPRSAKASAEREDPRSAKASAEREDRRSAKALAERQQQIVAAAAIARVDKDVADFPKGYETMVGERGITLSGGQKQRTAIARAVAIDPRILILDDALSAVDTYTEDEILSRLVDVMRARTSVIVSHRISTVRRADTILVLDQGRIVERGTHDELMAIDGRYRQLYEKQYRLERERFNPGEDGPGLVDAARARRSRSA
jgi:ATP-binding cassette subfamily B protein